MVPDALTGGPRFAAFCERFVVHTKGRWAGKPLVLEPWQREFAWEALEVDPATGLRVYSEVGLGLPRKNGKALALDTPIPTPAGWSTMGELCPGATVFDECGRPCRVVATSEVMLGRPCYRVSFSDGTSIVADAEHEWLVEPRWGRPTVLTTAAMADRVHVGHRSTHREHRYRVPVAGPLDCEGALLPVAPYTLGAWLGDGSSRSAAITTADPPILASIRAEGYRVGTARAERGAATLHAIGLRTAARPALQTTLRYQGLLGHKRIPPAYLRASMSQRLALLQGLMDTDGHVSPRGQCEFTTTSEALFGGTLELVRSLGMKPTWTAGRATLEGRDCGPKWRLRFHPPADLPVFRLARKRDRLAAHPGRRRRSESRHITAIEPVPSVPVRCIEVDAPSRLYLAGEAMVPTHNSLLASAFGHYFLVADGEAEPEVYVAAAARGQAGIVLGQARRIGLQSPLLRRHLRIQTHLIECPRNGGVMRALSADAALQHGLNPSANIIDELHAHRDGALYTALTTGTLAREQPFTLWITTAGATGTFLHQMYSVMETGPGELEDRGNLRIYRDRANGTLIWWYGAPDDADVDDPAVWRAANPASWLQDGKELGKEYARLKARGALTEWRTYHLDQFVEQLEGWMPDEDWRATAGDVRLRPDEPVYAAVRIAHDHRTAAVAAAQRQGERVVVSMRTFAASEGEYVGAAAVERHLRDLHARYPARVIAEVTVRAGKTLRRVLPGPEVVCHGAFFEPSRQRLAGEGLVMLDVPSTPERTGPAAAALMQLVTAGTLVHDGDPETARQMGRVTARAVPKGWALASATGESIVAPVAAMLAVQRALTAPRLPDRDTDRPRRGNRALEY